MKITERERWPDLVRGIAIILVIIGHTIQYVKYNNVNYEEDGVFLFIYSFHMPLFMFVSGYLFKSYVDRYSFIEGVWRKARSLLVPIIVWGILYCSILSYGLIVINKNICFLCFQL